MDITTDSNLKTADNTPHRTALTPPPSPEVNSMDIRDELTCNTKDDAQTSTPLPKGSDLEMIEFRNETVTLESPHSRDKSTGNEAQTEGLAGIIPANRARIPNGCETHSNHHLIDARSVHGSTRHQYIYVRLQLHLSAFLESFILTLSSYAQSQASLPSFLASAI